MVTSFLEYKNNTYNIGDIVYIHYWYNYMITPIKIIDKIGNKYLISHNIEQSKIFNAPNEKINKRDILGHYNEVNESYELPSQRVPQQSNINPEMIDILPDSEVADADEDEVISVPYRLEYGHEPRKKLYMLNIKIRNNDEEVDFEPSDKIDHLDDAILNYKKRKEE